MEVAQDEEAQIQTEPELRQQPDRQPTVIAEKNDGGQRIQLQAAESQLPHQEDSDRSPDVTEELLPRLHGHSEGSLHVSEGVPTQPERPIPINDSIEGGGEETGVGEWETIAIAVNDPNSNQSEQEPSFISGGDPDEPANKGATEDSIYVYSGGPSTAADSNQLALGQARAQGQPRGPYLGRRIYRPEHQLGVVRTTSTQGRQLAMKASARIIQPGRRRSQ